MMMRYRLMMLMFAAVSILSLPSSAQQTVKLPCIADNSIVMYKGEEHLNAGRKTRIRIKGNQHIVAMAFDTSAIKGKLVKSATLVCTKAEKNIEGVTISTIQAPWDEMKSNDLTDGLTRSNGWGVPGVRFPAVCGGNSFSLFCHSESKVVGGEYHWNVRRDLVHALAAQAAFGLAIHEDSSDYSRNPTIYSREQRGKEPYLLVTLGGGNSPLIPVANASIQSSGDPDSVHLRFSGQMALTYDITVNGKPVPRWNIPFARQKTFQVVFLRDFDYPAPGSRAIAAITPIGYAGQRGQTATIPFTWPRYKPPRFPNVPDAPASDRPASVTGIHILPIEDRYDASGNAVGSLPAGHLDKNALWQGEKGVILRAARGEVAGFQVLLDAPTASVQVKIPGMRTVVAEAVYVKAGARLIPDPLVEGRELKTRTSGKKVIVVDLYVPFNTNEKQVKGELSVSSGEKIPITVEIRKFSLPRQASFLCEMNSYGVPNKVREYYELQKMAADHRVHCNLLHYGKTYVNLLRDFAATARRQHWNRAGFQVYLNNKGSLNDKEKAPWILDEPTSYWDYRALAYYGDLTRAAVPHASDLMLSFRIDISRPQFTRGQLRGKSDLWVVSSGAFRNYERMLADRRVTQGETMWTYGTAGKVEASARDNMAWVLEAWLKGARGVVPWQTINRNGNAMKTADQLGLLIFDRSGGDPVIRPTMRLKSFRRAEQDIEYLELARAKAQWTPLQTRRFVAHYLTLSSNLHKNNEADAGTMQYTELTPASFDKLREACAAIIEGR